MPDIYLSSREKLSLVEELRDMFRSAKDSFYVGLSLYSKQCSIEKKQTSYIQIWNLSEPLLLGLIFTFLYAFRAIAPLEISLPYGLFVISGVLYWHTIQDGVTQPFGLISKSKEMLLNTNVKPESLIWSVLFTVVANTTYKLLIVLFFMAVFKINNPLAFLLVTIYFYLSACLMTGLGFFLEPFNAISSDVSRIISLILRPLMFVSGALFPVSSIEQLQLFNKINIFSSLLEFLRSLLKGQILDNVIVIISIFIGMVGLWMLGWYVFRVTVKLVAEKG